VSTEPSRVVEVISQRITSHDRDWSTIQRSNGTLFFSLLQQQQQQQHTFKPFLSFTMTLLGVPEFNIGTSSTTAPAAASGGGMDMSLGK
jgi:hypothetical protein